MSQGGRFIPATGPASISRPTFLSFFPTPFSFFFFFFKKKQSPALPSSSNLRRSARRRRPSAIQLGEAAASEDELADGDAAFQSDSDQELRRRMRRQRQRIGQPRTEPSWPGQEPANEKTVTKRRLHNDDESSEEEKEEDAEGEGAGEAMHAHSLPTTHELLTPSPRRRLRAARQAQRNSLDGHALSAIPM